MSLLETSTKKPVFDMAAAVPAVAAEHGKMPGAQLTDMLRLCVMGQKLSVEEYYALRLFEGDLDAKSKRRFVGRKKSKQLWDRMICGEPWLSTIRDKVACEMALAAEGLLVPRTLAVTDRVYEGGPETLEDEAAFSAFLEHAPYPIFGKPMDEIWSLGVARLVAGDAKSVELADGRRMTHAEFWNQIQTEFSGAYMFQECLAPHESMKPLATGSVGTLRVVTLDTGQGPKLFRAAAKLTSGSQCADNFWREGNMLASVDVKSGIMGPAITGFGVSAKRLERHPETDAPIAGAAYPMWEQAFDAALTGARAMPGAVLLGFDVAICREGPVVVEINETPDFMMLQIASGEGVLDDDLLAAFDHAGRLREAA